jgi:aspartate aminotransferase
MSSPEMSQHFASRNPSAIRLAQIEFMGRSDRCTAVNTAIGNVSLPMHPAMQKRMRSLGAEQSPFHNGVVPYSATVGLPEANRAFLNVIASSGGRTDGLFSHITDGGSQAMELLVVGTCGAAGSVERPLLLIDAAYTNYVAMAQRVGRGTVSVQRQLRRDGRFTLPDVAAIDQTIAEHRPGALVVIPYDNPTGQFYDHETMAELARLCVKHNMWMVSDEAYRELYYVDAAASSIWRLTDKEVPGIEGRRISIETASKVWNACGLRIGALVTDNKELHERAVAESTANLCSNVIGQYIVGALAHEGASDLQRWYEQQRTYYREMLTALTAELKTRLPGVIISSPDASIYSVVDVRDLVGPDFDAQDFVIFCARKGVVEVDGAAFTLLVAPMAEFYDVPVGQPNPGVTQMRIALVEPPEKMKLVPSLFAELLAQYRALSAAERCAP